MTCRICGSSGLNLILDLGMHPWANHFLRDEEVGTEPKYPLRLVHCPSCHGAQLDYTVKKEVMFSDHTYLSGITTSLSEHFRQIAEEVDERFCQGRSSKWVLDIGSNDGTQLKHFQRLNYEVMGVESSQTASRIANEAGVPTVRGFFNQALARELNRQFDIINAAGVFFHLEELHSACQGIRECLTNDGVFVTQFLYMKQIVRNLAFDQIYHEHLLYYNIATLERLLETHGIYVFDAYLSPIHGGSVISFSSKQRSRVKSERLVKMQAAEAASDCNTLPFYHRFADGVQALRTHNLNYLADRKARGDRIFGLGAPVKGNTLLNYFDIGTETLTYLVERNPLRRGLFSPGKHIPIKLEHEVTEPPNLYYVLAWNFRDEILHRYRSLIEQGVEFFFPIEPKID